MARKKKRLSRKQEKKQRQERVAQLRQAKGWQRRPSVSAPGSGQAGLLDDMLLLFPRLEDGPPTPAMMEKLMMTVMDSYDLIEEPEFDEMLIDPMVCIETFVSIGQEMGLEPEDLEELSDDEQADEQLDILTGTIERLLTPELRREILERLNRIRLRLKRSFSDRHKAARVAALQLMLGDNSKEASELWPMVGLVQAIFQRGLTGGFTLFEISQEAEGMDFEQIENDRLSFFERVSQSSLAQKADSLIRKVPGLDKFLSNQADKIWDEGEQAIFEGDLYLGLYTDEELEAGIDMMRPYMLIEDKGSISESELPEDDGKNLVLQVDQYVTNLFTPARFEQLQSQLKLVLKTEDYPRKYLPFVVMLDQHLRDEEALEYEKPFLIKSLIGEIRAHLQEMAVAAEKEVEVEE